MSRASPISRYLVRSNSPGEKVPGKKSVDPDSPTFPVGLLESPATPKLTRCTRLEKLLNEAIVEANVRIHQSWFSVTSDTQPDNSPTQDIMDTSGEGAAPNKTNKSIQREESCLNTSESTSDFETDFSSCEDAPRKPKNL